MSCNSEKKKSEFWEKMSQLPFLYFFYSVAETDFHIHQLKVHFITQTKFSRDNADSRHKTTVHLFSLTVAPFLSVNYLSRAFLQNELQRKQ